MSQHPNPATPTPTTTPHLDALRAAGIVGPEFDDLAQTDAAWVESLMALGDGSWTNGPLHPHLVELIGISINASVNHLNGDGVRRHMRRALQLGVPREQIIEVLRLGAVTGIHAAAIAIPLLDEELRVAGRADADAPHTQDSQDTQTTTPMCDHLRNSGGFNPMWETLYRWEPQWLERFLLMGSRAFTSGVLPALWVELLCIAGDAKVTHMYSPGTRRHIKAALALGASRDEIMQVIKIVSLQGIQSSELGLPILDEEMAVARANGAI